MNEPKPLKIKDRALLFKTLNSILLESALTDTQKDALSYVMVLIAKSIPSAVAWLKDKLIENGQCLSTDWVDTAFRGIINRGIPVGDGDEKEKTGKRHV